MIHKIMSQTRTTELDTVASRILAAYLDSSLDNDEHLKGIMDILQPIAIKLNHAINRIKSRSEQEAFDDIRDDAVRSFYYLVSGSTYNPDKRIKDAAVKIMDILDRYGLKVVNKNYSTESSLLNSLLTELVKTEMQETLSLISGATQSFVALQNAQDHFETNYLVYEQNKAKEGTYATATSIKNDVMKLVNGKLVVYLKAMGVVDEVTYGSFVRTVAQIIDDNNEVVKKRAKPTD